MEEILASIRRIISEDDAPGAAAGGAAVKSEGFEPPAEAAAQLQAQSSAAEEDDVLELTQRAPEPAPAETHGDVDVYSAKSEPEPKEDAHAHAEAAPATAPEPEPEAIAEPDAPAPRRDETLVGSPALESAASAFERLSASLVKPPAPPVTPLAMPAPGRTLEDLTRELLRPLLKSWLDENLPGIVQARVDEEVERIAHRRVR
jgi:cell pole-organizing protein PopZ